MFAEDNLLVLSALQHLLFGSRQCGVLIHIEQLWMENRLTAEGRILGIDREDPVLILSGSRKFVFIPF